jgi:hypothetical protein
MIFSKVGSEKERTGYVSNYVKEREVVRLIRTIYGNYLFSKRRFGFTGILQTPVYTPPPPPKYTYSCIATFFQTGCVLHPIYSATGDYPPVMKERISMLSKKEGYSRSRLPSFTKEEIEMVKGEFQFRETSYTTSRP